MESYQVFDESDIDFIMGLQEVIDAKNSIDSKSSGSVYFEVPLLPVLQQKIMDIFGLQLTKVPMRWIKGDTRPHIDKGASEFNNTHLVYLSDNPGEFVLGDAVYPIMKGQGYKFSEGLMHGTINTGNQPRLLLGPMSETGFAVGIPGIGGSGGDTIYLLDAEGSIYYSFTKGEWNYYIDSWPCLITNTNTDAGILHVEFVNNITFDNANKYFMCGSNNIQIGSNTLNDDGSRPIITIDGVAGYPGLIQNGTDSANGYSNISVTNLIVSATNSTLYASEGPGSGWVCQQYFARGGADNFVINCASDGPINFLCGGIVGPYAAANSGELSVIECTSAGSIDNDYAGGIIGYNIYENSGVITCKSCMHFGDVAGKYSGGIVGSGASKTTVTDCYVFGDITGEGAGGIIGNSAGADSQYAVAVSNCFSVGAITGYSSGGIAGSFANYVTIQNCYTTGNVTGETAGAICGFHNPVNNIVISHCYTTGTSGASGYFNGKDINNYTVTITNSFSEAQSGTPGDWNDANASTYLTGLNAVWISTYPNSFYAPINKGYTPYSLTNIASDDMIRTHTFDVTQGETTIPGFSGVFFGIVNNNESSITIDASNGAISTTSDTPVGTYTFYVIYGFAQVFNISVVAITLNVSAATVNPLSQFRFRKVYSDNARVYYKPGSNAPGGIGGVRNCRAKAYRI